MKTKYMTGMLDHYPIGNNLEVNNAEHNETNNTTTTTLTVTDLPKPNICLNKPVWVSSVENTGLDGKYAVDGFESTRWASAFKDKQWIIVDLQKKYNIDRIELMWEAAYSTEYYLFPFSKSGKCIISIFNLQGKLIQMETMEGKNIQLNIQSLKTGVYYIRTERESGMLTEKFIKF